VPHSSDVELDIFNQSGQSVFAPVNTYLEAGRYAIRFDSSSLPSGLYFYRLTSNEVDQTKTMMLLK